MPNLDLLSGGLPDEALNRMLGISPPDIPAEAAPETFNPTGWQRFLEGLSGLELSSPSGFGQSFAHGLGTSLVGQGQQVALARQKFEARQTERRKQTDEARREATKEYNKNRGEAVSRIATEQRAGATKAADYERDNPVLTAAMIAEAPAGSPLKRLKAGTRLSASQYQQALLKEPGEGRPAEPLVAIVGPDGKPTLVTRGEARGRTPFNPQAAGTKLPSATERGLLAADTNALAQAANIKKLFKPEFVGPYSGRRGAASMATGIKLRKGEAAFRGGLALYRNAVISALSGAAVSAQEAIRLQQQIPQETDPSDVFLAKLAQTENNMATVARLRRETFTETGLDLSGLSPLPGGAEGRTQVDLNQFVRP